MNGWSNSDDPILPYGSDDPTSGWSGSDTSEARARDADTEGVTARRQRQTMAALEGAGDNGMTWRELADALGLHHGGASGVLSVLHKSGRISRLSLTRLHCKVYVVNEYVNGRTTERHGRTAATGLLQQAIGVLRDYGPCTFHRAAYPEPDCLACRGQEVVNEYERRNQ